ncbi:flagellar rod assembly protein FlgJ [Azospirillum thiophilum]|uniref:Flagellar biosynthesis protein FlgJ n=1 Tax=Azospirillum thiophilum TaxID=528244 RepID=A0AAC8ZTV0_9PROT|nr:rod-binding protein [Azospirillum thiophilum]ALG71272.1 flagellar biosynthesis protein FlgJ [Azospirillum thiophilum]KJR65072.1 flagellar rod assembly protein FlgJ [Azospirillum thiophilum]
MTMSPAISAASAPPSLVERAQAAGYGVRTLARISDLEAKVDPAKLAQLRKSATEFESQFVSQMLGPMFEGIGTDETFGGGRGEEMFRPMLIEQFGKQITQRGGFGIANQVYQELLRAQEASHG